MTEDDAKQSLVDVPRETVDLLDAFAEFLTTESRTQNLIAASTIPHIWARHIIDSIQLLPLAPTGSWLDLGSGAGFPGLMIAAVGQRPVTLVEARSKRITFLEHAAEVLGIASLVTIVGTRVQALPAAAYDVISARAFAPLPILFATALHQSTPATTWLLPKGRSAVSELEAARAAWQGDLRTVPSTTDPESAIIVATGVRPRGRR